MQLRAFGDKLCLGWSELDHTSRRFRKPAKPRPPAADWLPDAPIPTPRGGRGREARGRPSRRAHARARALRMVAGTSHGVDPTARRLPAGCTSRRVVSASPRASWKVVSRRSGTPGDARGGWSRLPGPGAGPGARACVSSPRGCKAVVGAPLLRLTKVQD